MTGHTSKVNCAVMSDNRMRVISGSSDGTVRVWEVRSGGQIERAMIGHQSAKICVALSEDGRRIVSGSSDNRVRVWEVESVCTHSLKSPNIVSPTCRLFRVPMTDR